MLPCVVPQIFTKEYLKIIADHTPPVFVMENVPGLLSSKLNGTGIFDQMHAALWQLRASYELVQRVADPMLDVHRRAKALERQLLRRAALEVPPPEDPDPDPTGVGHHDEHDARTDDEGEYSRVEDHVGPSSIRPSLMAITRSTIRWS